MITNHFMCIIVMFFWSSFKEGIYTRPPNTSLGGLRHAPKKFCNHEHPAPTPPGGFRQPPKNLISGFKASKIWKYKSVASWCLCLSFFLHLCIVCFALFSLLTVTCPKTEFSRDKCLMLPEHRIFGTKVGGAENIFTALVYEVKNVRKLLEQ